MKDVQLSELKGETVTDVRWGNEDLEVARRERGDTVRPYSKITIVCKSGRHFVFGVLMGEVTIDEMKE